MPRKDLDSILDAALDELDDNLETNGNFESDVHGKSSHGASVSDGNNFSCNNNSTTSTTTKTTSLGVPYSLDYLSRCEQELSTSGSRTSDGNNTKAPMFGPEPPPPPPTDFFDTAAAALMSDKSVQKEMEQFQKELENFDFNGSEDFNELFQRMNQAFPGVNNLDFGDDAEFDTAMKNMMRMANTGRVENSGNSDRSNTKMSSTTTTSRSKHQSTNRASDMPSPANNTDRSKQCFPQQVGASTNQTIPSKNIATEQNVDESIHRLLEGINKASSSTPTNNNNNNNSQRLPFPPSLPPGMENIDPSQFEEFSEEIMSTLMNEFEQMGNKDDSNIVVDNVMKQLLDRDIMYEPMKEVCTRFPKYLAEHKDTLSSEEYTRYGTQYQYFQRIVHVYETEPNNFDRLMELMQDIQEYGQPPVEIIKELAPELEFDAEGMPIMSPGRGGGGGMPPFLPGMTGNEQCCIS